MGMGLTMKNNLKIAPRVDFDRDLVFEEAFGTSEGLKFMNSIYGLLAHEMLLMGRDGTVIPIPRESNMALALPLPANDRFANHPTIFKGANENDFVGLPIRYECDVFAMLILDKVVFADHEVSVKLKPAQNMIEWYIHVIHQRRMICELQAKTQTLSYDELIQEHAQALVSADKYRKISDTLQHAYLDTIYRLSITAEYKDHDTADHVKRMSIYSKMLAEKLGLKADEVSMILCASPMHDIGKMGVPDAILLKPGPLNQTERRVMEQHPTFGADILGGSDSEVLEYGKIIALTHHEKWDGTGYPNQSKGKNIPLAGRIVAVADVFDALTTNRPYRRAWSFDEAMSMLVNEYHEHFDPEILECFLGARQEVRIIFDNYKDIAPWSFGA